MKFKDIKKIPDATYRADIPLKMIPEHLERFKQEHNLNMDPDFQKTSYIEWLLRGGKSGREIYFNHPNWMGNFKGELLLIDGKQRLTSVLEFFENKFPVFNHYFQDFEDKLFWDPSLSIHIFKFQTRLEILEWYLMMNTGGTIHTNDEIEKVKKLIDEEKSN